MCFEYHFISFTCDGCYTVIMRSHVYTKEQYDRLLPSCVPARNVRYMYVQVYILIRLCLAVCWSRSFLLRRTCSLCRACSSFLIAYSLRFRASIASSISSLRRSMLLRTCMGGPFNGFFRLVKEASMGIMKATGARTDRLWLSLRLSLSSWRFCSSARTKSPASIAPPLPLMAL